MAKWTFPADEDLKGRDPRLKDLRNFAYKVLMEIWDVSPTRVQYDLCDQIQQCILGNAPAKKMIQAQRGEGKSVILSIAAVWIFYWWSLKKIFVASASEVRATAFATFVLSLLQELDWLSFLAPDKKLGDRVSVLSFDLRGIPPAHDPSMRAVGVMGHMAGSHADVIMPDDIEIPNNSDTPPAREKLKERTKEFEAIGNPGARQIWLGTPQSEDTVYACLPERGFMVLKWPGLYPGTDEFPLSDYEGTLAPMLLEDLLEDPSLAGKPTDPERFGSEILEEKRAAYGLAGFSLQFMLNTRLSDAARQPLRLRDLIVTDLSPDDCPERAVWCNDPEHMANDIPSLGKDGDYLYRPMSYTGSWGKYSRKVLSIDQSGTGADETAWVVLGERGGNIYLLALGGYPDCGETALDGLADTAVQYGVGTVTYEEPFGGQLFADALGSRVRDRGLRCEFIGTKPTSQKELRIIRHLEPVLSTHRLIVSAESLRQDYASAKAWGGETWPIRSLMHQLTRITRDRGCLAHDDRVDVLAQGVAQFQAVLAVSVLTHSERGAKRHRRPTSLRFLSEPPRKRKGILPNRGIQILRDH